MDTLKLLYIIQKTQNFRLIISFHEFFCPISILIYSNWRIETSLIKDVLSWMILLKELLGMYIHENLHVAKDLIEVLVATWILHFFTCSIPVLCQNCISSDYADLFPRSVNLYLRAHAWQSFHVSTFTQPGCTAGKFTCVSKSIKLEWVFNCSHPVAIVVNFETGTRYSHIWWSTWANHKTIWERCRLCLRDVFSLLTLSYFESLNWRENEKRKK